jgi:hypothetical protein
MNIPELISLQQHPISSTNHWLMRQVQIALLSCYISIYAMCSCDFELAPATASEYY